MKSVYIQCLGVTKDSRPSLRSAVAITAIREPYLGRGSNQHFNTARFGGNLGCNAWNHPPGCTCGWGGDTGGGGHSTVRHLRPADGLLWSRRSRTTIESYTVPNAHCPVCGAAVFFYQSPYGGRVFFDDLGPPWPKHPCTDNGSASKGVSQRWQSPETIIIANDITNLPKSGVPQAVAALHRWSVRNWRPLLPENVPTAAGDLIWIDAKIRIHGKVSQLPIPTSAWCDAPIYWRWSDEPGKVEIETIDARDILDIRTVKATIPAWLEQNDDVEISAIFTIEAVPAPAGDRWNRLGWELSFFWALQNAIYDTAKKHGWVDWPLSIRCFEQATKAGDWAGANNLGVIYRDGHGVERDPEQAFHWFTIAANSLQDRALENLARCYREGIGSDPDPDMADFVEDLRSNSNREDDDGG